MGNNFFQQEDHTSHLAEDTHQTQNVKLREKPSTAPALFRRYSNRCYLEYNYCIFR